MTATKPDGSRWFARTRAELEANWRSHAYSAPVLAELQARVSWFYFDDPKGSAPSLWGMHVISKGWPPNYWDRLRVDARFRDEVNCQGCGEWLPFAIDREPMSSGLLPSAVTFRVACQFCSGLTVIGFSWLSWHVIHVHFECPPTLVQNVKGGDA